MEDESYFNNLNTEHNFYFTVVCVPVGILLNLVSIYVFQRPRLNKTTMGFMFTYRSIVDILLLLTVLLLIRGDALFQVVLYQQSDILCKLFYWLKRLILHMSSFNYVIITLDRFFSICFPTRFGFLKKKRTLALTFALTAIALALVDIPNLFYYLDTDYFYKTRHSQNQTVENQSYVTICTASVDIAYATDILSVSLRCSFRIQCHLHELHLFRV
jgi:hypothetical protein